MFHDREKAAVVDIDKAFGELKDTRAARAIIRLSRSSLTNHVRDRLHEIKAPTLVVWGRHDMVTPVEAAEELHAKVKGSRLVWLENCGHVPMLEAPEAFAAAIEGFVDELNRG